MHAARRTCQGSIPDEVSPRKMDSGTEESLMNVSHQLELMRSGARQER